MFSLIPVSACKKLCNTESKALIAAALFDLNLFMVLVLMRQKSCESCEVMAFGFLPFFKWHYKIHTNWNVCTFCCKNGWFAIIRIIHQISLILLYWADGLQRISWCHGSNHLVIHVRIDRSHTITYWCTTAHFEIDLYKSFIKINSIHNN